ncbi:MAG TPA: ABC transporter permease [Vicinamibacterales bacterium]|nr:ABC transporter permease [Vicinamibacterales bacterium]
MALLEHLVSDLRFAGRQFVRRPGLTLAALFALTCGLGGVTTVFTLVDAVILRPLPVASPHELVWMRHPSFSYPVFEEVSARAGMLSRVFAWESRQFQAQWTADPESTPVLLATGGIHETLGLRPAAGRLLTPADSGRSAADAQPVAVLSYAAWQRRFGGSPDAIGQTLRIEGTPFTIVGVTPPGFYGVAVGVPVDVTIPLTMLPRIREDERRTLTEAGRSWLHIMGRLRPGLSATEADAAFQTIWPEILRATAEGVSPAFRPRYLKFTSGLEPGASGESPVRRQFRDALWLLFGLVALLLVVACATVANLLLAGAAARQQELAVRFALGATWQRVAQQLFAEGLLLAVTGAALGLLFSAWATDVLLQLLSTSYESVVVDAAPDARVLAFVALAVWISTIAFTIAPIARASRFGRTRTLVEASGRHTDSPHRAYMTRALVAVQVAVSLTLLAGSALFARNLWQLLAADIGFDRENLMVVAVDAMSPLSAPRRRAAGTPDFMPYYAELLRNLREAAGVRSASLSFKPPISNEQGSWWDTFSTDTNIPPPTPGNRTYLNAVSPEYFATIGLPLLAGRDFVPGDREGAPAAVIINLSLARAQFGDDAPIGRHLFMGPGRTRLEVVGVVRDAAYQSVGEDRRRIAYLPYMQAPDLLNDRSLVAAVRVAGPPGGLAESLRAAVRKVDPSVPLTIQTVRHRIDESLVQERLLTAIAVFLGATSLLLACGALAGLMSHTVTARTREIGLRLALGAEPGSVVRLVMHQALVVAVLGAVAGLGLTLVSGRLVASFLSTIEPSDPWALSAAAVLLSGTAAVAGYLPARRAARLDPMIALRAE